MYTTTIPFSGFYNWLDKHSINCYKCGELVDERDCMPNTHEYGGNNDGGEICSNCFKKLTGNNYHD